MEHLAHNLKRHVVELSETIGERNYVQYQALTRAADYIIREFTMYGYDPEIQSYDVGKDLFKNIIAVKNGSTKPEEVIVIGAHYDSVVGSPGANDNGSGVSALLELARLCLSAALDRTVKFTAFVNEEPPFFLSGKMGSRVYAQDARRRGEDIKAMISLETIGYYSEKRHSQSYPLWFGLLYPDQANFVGVIGNFGSRNLVKRIKDVFRDTSQCPVETAALPAIVPGVNFSDHDSFWRYGYQACMVTDTAFYRYPYYHTTGDTYEKINYEKLAQVVHGLRAAAIDLANA